MNFFNAKSSLWRRLLLSSTLFLGITVYSQVGIGTTNPAATSMLDISSTTKGLLAPRMTTVQRTAIATPANSLLVYDTDLKAFYYYEISSTVWVKINSSAEKRNNHVLVKSAADFPAPASGKITLVSNTYYEINGTIMLPAPIDLNDAYVSGLDANEDILFRATGPVFEGITGGSIRNITITGGAGASAFNITGGGSLLVQGTIIANLGSVGTISNLFLYFANIVQFSNNTTGITYSGITNLLLSNQAWLGDNGGTYEKFTGTFGLVEKASGFTTVKSGAFGLDVSSNPTVANGVLLGTVFSGVGTYVKPYAAANTYLGYNFSNTWTVNCPGIPKESDDLATANLYFDTSSVVNVSSTTAFKLPVNTKSIRLFRSKLRASPNENNSIIYQGNKSRAVNIFANFSFTATGGSRYSFTIYKNGAVVDGTEAIFDVLSTNQRQTASVIGTVNVAPGDFVEIYVQKTTNGNEQFLVTSYNLIMN